MALHSRKLSLCGCLPQQLERFMRGESPRDECRLIVRHLLSRCPECVAITRRILDVDGSSVAAGGTGLYFQSP
jgi:hypothetical protein